MTTSPAPSALSAHATLFAALQAALRAAPLLVAGVLTGCGGSDGGVTSTPAPTQNTASAPTTAYSPPAAVPSGYVITPEDLQPIRSANDTAEFRQNYNANEFVNALYALDNGYTGKGVTVGVIDDGAVNVNGELTGRISALSQDFGDNITNAGASTARDTLGDANSTHGTPVANIIAANANGVGTVGYAPGVSVAILRVDDTNTDTATSQLSVSHTIAALNYAAAKGINIINASFAVTAVDSAGNPTVPLDFRNAVDSFATKTNGLIVMAAGNNAAASPTTANIADTTNIASLIFVGALAPNLNTYQLASYSDKPGAYASRYVVAPGANVTTGVDGSLVSFAGTSSATPVVTALAATIQGKWPTLTGQQIASIILNTADPIGDSATFGKGLVDFKAALSPVNPTLTNGTATSTVATSAMTVSPAASTAAIGSALGHVTVLDSYGRDFTGSIAALVSQPQAATTHAIERRVDQLAGPADFAVSEGGMEANLALGGERVAPGPDGVRAVPVAGHFGWRHGAMGFHYDWNTPAAMQGDTMGLAPLLDPVLAYAPQAASSFGLDRLIGHGQLSVSFATGHSAGVGARAVTVDWQQALVRLRVAWIDEDGSFLGMPTGSGALRLGRGATSLVSEAHATLLTDDNWALEGYGSLGISRLKIDPASMVTGATSIIASRMGVQLSGPVSGGRFSMGLAQPLNIERGVVQLTYASGYNAVSNQLAYSNAMADIAGHRRTQVTMGYTRATDGVSLRIGLMQDLSDGSTQGLMGLSHRF